MATAGLVLLRILVPSQHFGNPGVSGPAPIGSPELGFLVFLVPFQHFGSSRVGFIENIGTLSAFWQPWSPRAGSHRFPRIYFLGFFDSPGPSRLSQPLLDQKNGKTKKTQILTIRKSGYSGRSEAPCFLKAKRLAGFPAGW